jgi:hemerythrin
MIVIVEGGPGDMIQSIPVEHLLLSVPQMDDEHRALISQANECIAAVDADASHAEFQVRLTQLIAAFQAHFDSEEVLMRSSGFPGLTPHAEEHHKLIEQMKGLRDDVGRGDIQICGALALFVRLWTEKHITGQDLSFAQFLGAGSVRRP